VPTFHHHSLTLHTMSALSRALPAIKEIRLHLCQSGQASAGAR
jgi:hypothetical protein